ncbi:type III secretion system export apparatus subunit SctR [Parachitinimonas caeni]|uniref:Type III secretion system export apparatus subunit SctR n=1 Tax=Parachitinimonas caeni TaxID=3031301 RepID=A0ABT7DTV0_9NEIS|nr:type III secretion system export apparatus subunit SctR [Parachitinimonas caeni]MDK2123501.1 type III secretion system export apparatus subunit SctR [Parachitinimonas caeni]
MSNFDPISLALALALLALVPILVVTTTAFLKISIVLSLVRNALGVQQIPPNMALYGLSLVLTLYVMAPVGQKVYEAVHAEPAGMTTVDGLISGVQKGAEPMRAFLMKHSKPEQRGFFVRTTKRLWPAEMSAQVKPDDYLILMPAFVVSELTAAFEIGFLLYLPFLVIDLVVSNILLAMGMMMVSPVTISLPLKLFLFVMVDGWTRLIQGLILTYI